LLNKNYCELQFAYTDISHIILYNYANTGREMNIQVATSELPITSVRSGPRLSGINYTQRPQTRFRGNRGTGSIRGNLQILMQKLIHILIIYYLLN